MIPLRSASNVSQNVRHPAKRAHTRETRSARRLDTSSTAPEPGLPFPEQAAYIRPSIHPSIRSYQRLGKKPLPRSCHVWHTHDETYEGIADLSQDEEPAGRFKFCSAIRSLRAPSDIWDWRSMTLWKWRSRPRSDRYIATVEVRPSLTARSSHSSTVFCDRPICARSTAVVFGFFHNMDYTKARAAST